MSNERHHPDDIADPIVSGTYREIADESTPEHLDHMVLNEARSAGLQSHRKLVSWLRPAAWVTTIGLCLAIVLEVADMSQQEQAVFDTPAKDQEESIAVTPASDAVDVPAQQYGSADVKRSKSLNKSEPASRDEGAGRFETAPAAKPETRHVRQDTAAAIEVDSLDDADTQIIGEAEQRARLQTGSDEEAGRSVSQPAPRFRFLSEVAEERYCSESETGDRESWLECIQQLEKDGLHEAARIEHELLKEAFPPAKQP